jgi:hypothetical protein
MFVTLFGVCWGVLYSLLGDEALPLRGNYFALMLLFFLCVVGGYIAKLLHLPELLGEF